MMRFLAETWDRWTRDSGLRPTLIVLVAMGPRLLIPALAHAQVGEPEAEAPVEPSSDGEGERTPDDELAPSVPEDEAEPSPRGDASVEAEPTEREALGPEFDQETEATSEELDSPSLASSAAERPAISDRPNDGEASSVAESSEEAAVAEAEEERLEEPVSESRDVLTFGGDLRLRYEGRSNFKFNDTLPGNDENILLARLRLRSEWTPVDWFSTYAEVQHAAIYFEDAIDQDAYPTVFADTIDLHQVYIDLQPTIGLGPSIGALPTRLRVGRQKLNFGGQRLIASLEWVNTARVFDGATLRLGSGDGRNATVFATWLVPVDPNRLNRSWDDSGNRMFDSSFHGIYWTDPETLPSLTYDAYYLVRLNADVDDAVHTVGTRVVAPLGDVRLDSEAALQFGTFGGVRHLGYMLHVGVGHVFPSFYEASLGVAYNVGSGDDDPTDDVHGTFDNLFPLNHAYYGYMDFFALQNVHNVEGVARFKPFGLDVRAAMQLFWLVNPASDAWYNAGGAPINAASPSTPNGFVGAELDVTVGWKIDHLALHVGYGHFFSGSYVRDAGRSGDADFVYVQSTVSM